MSSKRFQEFVLIPLLIAIVIVVWGKIHIQEVSEKPLADEQFMRALQFLPEEEFTFIALPDTQKYAKYYPDLFCEQTQWIVDHKDTLNIKFVAQLGDIIDSGSFAPGEWSIASECMKKLDGVIPYSIAPGNHDYERINDRSSGFATFNATFPVSRFDASWYRGNYKGNQNSLQVITVRDQDFAFINLEPEAPDDVIEWANTIANTYKDMYIITTMHKYLRDSGEGRTTEVQYGDGGNSGETLWRDYISRNCSIRQVWSGHFHAVDGEFHQFSNNMCGDVVYESIQDYQSREKGGNGLLRLYIFNPRKNIVRVFTYSSHTKTFETDADSEFEFPYKSDKVL